MRLKSSRVSDDDESRRRRRSSFVVGDVLSCLINRDPSRAQSNNKLFPPHAMSLRCVRQDSTHTARCQVRGHRTLAVRIHHHAVTHSAHCGFTPCQRKHHSYIVLSCADCRPAFRTISLLMFTAAKHSGFICQIVVRLRIA